jgi:two-component sensor histidine kinase
MKRLGFIMLILFMINSVRGQSIILNISQHEATDLRNLLNKKVIDTERMDILLKLAEYNILKDGNDKANLDSADEFIKQASVLNSKIRSIKYAGYITLEESCLARKTGDLRKAEEGVNKAIQLLQVVNADFYLTKAYFELSQYYNPNAPTQLAKINNLINKELLQLKKIKSTQQRAYCIHNIEYFYHTNLYGGGDRVSKLNFLGHLIPVFRQIDNKESEMWARKEIADLHLQQGKTTVAENELLELLKEHKAGGYPHICFTYDLLVSVYIYQARYSQSLFYAFESIKSVRLPLDSLYLSDFYRKVAMIYEYLHDRDQSVVWERKRLNYLISKKQTDDIYSSIKRIVEDSIKKGKPKEALSFMLDIKKNFPPANFEEKKYMSLSMALCYAALHENALAEKHYLEMIEAVEIQINRKELVFDLAADQYIGKFYLNTGQYGKAKKYLKKTLGEWLAGANASRDLFKNDFMFKIDSAGGNYFAAIKDLKRSQKINDSIFNATKSKQIGELQIAYETEQKKKDIKLLQDNEKIQQIKLQHTENTRNWIIAGSGMLILLLGVSYNRYRLKQRSNQIITHKNELLQHLLTEKEWLLKEVHHRVKNNLHTVICLLESQAAYLENDALKAIENSQHRIYAMSLIHQKLYQSEDIKTIDMSLYLPEFVQFLGDCFGAQRQIQFKLAIEPLMLGVSQAIPTALIINEAVTNSIKYAFPEKRVGVIEIAMYQVKDRIELIITDNGVGIKANIANTPSDSLGLKLMKGLSEDINASFSIVNEKGTIITIIFNVDPLNDSNNLLAKIKERGAYS